MTFVYYFLLIYLAEEERLAVGSLGTFTFPKGFYVYVGRDRRNIHSRVARHLRRNKTLRWHIDYLSQKGQVIMTKMLTAEQGPECVLARQLLDLGGETLLKGFGSSDCTCATHLVYFSSYPSLEGWNMKKDPIRGP